MEDGPTERLGYPSDLSGVAQRRVLKGEDTGATDVVAARDRPVDLTADLERRVIAVALRPPGAGVGHGSTSIRSSVGTRASTPATAAATPETAEKTNASIET